MRAGGGKPDNRLIERRIEARDYPPGRPYARGGSGVVAPWSVPVLPKLRMGPDYDQSSRTHQHRSSISKYRVLT